MIINSLAPTSYEGMYKVSPDCGAAFFVRQEYVPSIKILEIEKGTDFNEEQTSELLDAGLACVVELKAVTYLARCEQCRFGLKRKLMEKEYDSKYINMALDFLESKKYLSDERFARAWLHTRQINHYEGRSKLQAELMSRGISKEVSVDAIAEFFTENDESEICKKAFEKYKKKGKDGDKLIAAMLQSGFTYKQVKELISLKD